MVDDPDIDTYVGSDVADDSGTEVGTIVDVDRDAGEFALEPSEELDVNTWQSIGWHTADEYDTDWEDLDYERWQAGESEIAVDYDEWPYTLAADRLEDVGGDPEDGDEELRLRG